MHDIHTQDHWIDGGQGRLFVRTWLPQAPRSDVPIILLHDSLGSVELWRGFPASLCVHSGRPVMAYDRLGFGKSDARVGKLALDFVESEAETGFAALRQGLDIGHFVLFGHSVGGGMAVNCAARSAGACVGLITEAAQAFVEDRTLQGIEEARKLFADPAQLDRLRKFHGDKAEWVLEAWIGSWLNPAFAAWSLESVLPAVKCPMLAIHGAEDEYGSPRHLKLIGALTGGPAQVEIMPSTRHVPHREREAEVTTLVCGFLQNLA